MSSWKCDETTKESALPLSFILLFQNREKKVFPTTTSGCYDTERDTQEDISLRKARLKERFRGCGVCWFCVIFCLIIFLMLFYLYNKVEVFHKFPDKLCLDLVQLLLLVT